MELTSQIDLPMLVIAAVGLILALYALVSARSLIREMRRLRGDLVFLDRADRRGGRRLSAIEAREAARRDAERRAASAA